MVSDYGVCPADSLPPAQVTAEDGTLRDLSQLARRAGAWETTERADGQTGDLFYINMCRALNHTALPSPCGGQYSAAVRTDS